MINIAALASGSNGNCYFFENDADAVLVDAGVSCKQIIQRMQNLSLDIDKIRGIFVTHEHSDHIRGIDVLSRKFEIPVFITKKTLANSGLDINDKLLNIIKIAKNIKVGKIKVNPFAKMHDAVEPCSYVLSYDKRKVGVMTDIGEKCDNVVSHIKDCDALFLETNYDELMLEKGRYPYYLKKRISGSFGHLSNYQAALLVLEHASPKLKHVFLSHLSANNNTPQLASQILTSFVKERKDLDVSAIMTSREKETDLLNIP